MPEPPSRQELMEKLQGVVHRCFFNEGIVLHDSMTADDIDGWDSLSHVRLLMLIEDTFQIRLADSEASRLKCVGDLVDLIHRHLFPHFP